MWKIFSNTSNKLQKFNKNHSHDSHKFFKERHGIKPLTKEQHEYFERKREARRLEEKMKRKKRRNKK